MKLLILALLLFAMLQNPQAPTSTVPPPPVPRPSTAPLVYQADLEYAGTFRVPAPTKAGTLEYGGHALAFRADTGTLLTTTLDQRVVEISIPWIRRANTLAALDRAAIVQPYTDVLQGHRRDKGQFSIYGLLPWAERLIVSVSIAYDAAPVKTKLSHFRTGLDFAHLGALEGPAQLGTGEAGFVGGYMAVVPPEWRSALGGPVLTGQCCLSIITRTSFGPSVSVFDPGKIATSPAPVTRLLGYPSSHPTLGGCNGTRFNCATSVAGVVFPAGTRSVLFFGTLGSNYCYGEGTKDPKLDGKPIKPGSSVRYCYDPTSSSKGTHGYPYASYVWAYDANDLAAVKAGKAQPWEVRPYDAWALDLPFATASRRIEGAAYDPMTKRIYLSQYGADGKSPVVHVLTVR